VPLLAARFRTHREWASTPLPVVLKEFSRVETLTATTLESTVFLNRGSHCEVQRLPAEAQWAPAAAVSAQDFNGDGRPDIFLGQNVSAVRPGAAPLNNGRGLLLINDGKKFRALSTHESGIALEGDQRGICTADFDEDGLMDLVAGQNGGRTRLFRNEQNVTTVSVRLNAGPQNPSGVGATVRLTSRGKVIAVQEVQGGSGWLAHNGSSVSFPAKQDPDVEIQVRWPGGRETRAGMPGAQRITLHADGNLTTR
jgi:hypothetical protein